MLRLFVTFLVVLISTFASVRANRPKTGAAGLLDAHFSNRVLGSLDCHLTSPELKRFYKERVKLVLHNEREIFKDLRGGQQEDYDTKKLAILAGEYDQQVKTWAGKVCEASQLGHKVFITFDPTNSLPEMSEGEFIEDLSSITDELTPGNTYESGSSGFKLELSGITVTTFSLGVLVGAALALQFVKFQSSQQVVATRLRRPEL
mmetsp:Transcript_6564/g.21887  ORF Transcript_6564/g.21887 Transcript_6564/m.21887 type:complete len:204 (-) Transcript_6564:2117-2728(-)